MVLNLPIALVGRGRELDVLRNALRELAAGRGRSLLIEGEPGIGKSALLEAGLDGAPGEVLSGACDELAQRFPLSVMMNTLGVHSGATDPHRARTAAALAEPSGRGTGDQGWSVSMQAGDPVLAAVEQLLGLVDRLCTAGSLVLAVDDLHWADDATLLLWRHLAKATLQLPLLLVGSCRPVPRREELIRFRDDHHADAGTLISLERLTADGVSKLARQLVNGRVGPALAARLEMAAGNPLYIREMLDELSRLKALEASGGIVDLVGGADALVVSLSDAIANRFDFVTRETRAVLRMAALLGTDFSTAELSSMTGSQPAELVTMMEEATAAGVLESTGARLRFRHGLLRESLYESMPASLRVALHQQVAQSLIASNAPVERVAAALLANRAAVDGWEADWLAAHASGLAHRAPEIAAELLTHALEHVPEDDPHHPVLQDHLLAVAFLLARHAEVERLGRWALSGAVDGWRIGQVSWLLGYTLMRVGRYEEALQVVGDAVTDVRVDPLWRARLRPVHALVLLAIGRLDKATGVAMRALEEGDELADTTAKAWALHARAMARVMASDPTGALALLDQALAVAGADPQLADLRLVLLSNRAAALSSMGRGGDSGAVLQEARELAERTGTPRLGMVIIASATHAFEQGRWDDALAELELVSALPDQTIQFMYQHGISALIAEHRDDQDEADRRLKPLRELGAPSGWTLLAAGPLLAARALDAERRGNPELGLEILGALLTPEYTQFVQDRADWLPMLVRMALATENRDIARKATEACAELAEREQLARSRIAALWCQALLDGDPEPLLAVADDQRTVGRAYHAAIALEDAAVALAALGRTNEAREAFGTSLEGFAAMGAVWDARRAAKRLRLHGIRPGVRGPRRRPRTGWEALTATELRVVELVAQGRGNSDIADRLLLSRRTVESHVSHILAKLEANSRREISQLAELYRAG